MKKKKHKKIAKTFAKKIAKKGPIVGSQWSQTSSGVSSWDDGHSSGRSLSLWVTAT